MPPSDFEQLRLENYNATVLSIRRCHEELLILRVRPDRGIPRFLAGQYTVLGLGYWEPRVANVQTEEIPAEQLGKLVKRAYSISSSILDEGGKLVGTGDSDFFEFYVSLVRHATPAHPPALSPRLFALHEGDRVLCGPHVHGNYTLRGVYPDDNVILAATGTGEAPHNAMAAQLLLSEHRGRIVVATCARRKNDLAYLPTHRRLEQRFRNYRYIALTTRERENLDATSPGYIGKRYLQDFFSSGEFERDTGLELVPEKTHVFLCGSPDMIGAPIHTHETARRYPTTLGMVEVLERRGFEIDRPHQPGRIHFEKYW